VTLKPLWKKAVLKWIIPRSIGGLSTTHLPWLWLQKNINVPLRLRGGWMKPNIKVKGVYLYRAVDKFGDTFDFMLSEHTDEATPTMPD
jgi:hypothetical protein